MNGFNRYDAEMEKFEKSYLFKKKYNAFIALLKKFGAPLTSKHIESELRIKGSAVRKLAQYARRKGLPLCSNENGYFMGVFDEVEDTIHHLNQRAKSIAHTAKCMQDQLNREKRRIRRMANNTKKKSTAKKRAK